jgi:hypothetical protein
MRWSAGLLVVLVIAGCSSVPFQKISYVPLDGVDSLAIVDKYKSSLPQHLRLLNTLVYRYGWKKFSTIGYIDIDRRTKTFTAVSLTPMGFKLFELTGDENSVKTSFMLEEFGREGDFARVAGEDIRRIYFDLIPSADAQIIKERFRIIFRQRFQNGALIYVFAGKEGYLIEKKYYENSKLNWSVSYYEYQQKDGKIYPRGIILNNYKYGYNLVIKLKEIES